MLRAGPRGARARETDSAVFSMSNLIKKNVHPIPSTGMAPSQPPGTGHREPHSLHARAALLPSTYEEPHPHSPARAAPSAQRKAWQGVGWEWSKGAPHTSLTMSLTGVGTPGSVT